MFLLTWRNITQRRARAWISLGSVVFGIAAFLLAGGFIEWIFWAMRESTIGSRLGHIQVVVPAYHQQGSADPFAYLLPQQHAARSALDAIPGVKAVGERIALSGLISHDETTASFIGEGMEPAAERLLSSYVIQAAGEPLDDADARGVLLGEGLAENLGLEPGDKVALLATPSAGGVNAVEATVRGIFYTSNKPYDDAAIRMPIALARKLLRVEGSHQWVALLDDTERTDAVVADLRARFRDAGVEFVPWHELADFYHKTVQLFSRQLGLVWVLIGALILLTIANTQTRAVLERTHEIGVLMATGWRRGRVLRFFLVEGLLIGLIGAVGGIMFAFGVANLVEWSGGIPMPPPPGMNRGYTAQIMLNGALVAQAVALALASATAAGAWPAWRASRLDVVDALRHCA